jgi:hypothetical protein
MVQHSGRESQALTILHLDPIGIHEQLLLYKSELIHHTEKSPSSGIHTHSESKMHGLHFWAPEFALRSRQSFQDHV